MFRLFGRAIIVIFMSGICVGSGRAVVIGLLVDLDVLLLIESSVLYLLKQQHLLGHGFAILVQQCLQIAV